MSTASSQHDPHLATPTGKPRARAVGLKYRGTPGPHNAITDVPGVEVGYTTLIEGDSVRAVQARQGFAEQLNALGTAAGKLSDRLSLKYFSLIDAEIRTVAA